MIFLIIIRFCRISQLQSDGSEEAASSQKMILKIIFRLIQVRQTVD